MMTELTLGVISFLTSTVAGVVGIGGGMMLITILPSFLPLNALIPVHGLTQMSSNFSRAVFGYKDVQFEVIPKFLLGSLIGDIMKILLIVTIFMFHFLFANDNYGKIDMHGGKSENILNDKNSLSNKDFKNIGINKPTTPKVPQNLIKEDKKEEKKENSK